MATPFKMKDVNEDITPKDIRSLMEQANYTNYQENPLVEKKISPKPKNHEGSTSHVPKEKPLFKPFKISEKAKQKFRELRKKTNPLQRK